MDFNSFLLNKFNLFNYCNNKIYYFHFPFDAELLRGKNINFNLIETQLNNYDNYQKY